MATITVRGLDDDVQRRLRERASRHGRSMEAEVRAILGEAVGPVDFVSDWLALAIEYRGAEPPTPARSMPRGLDL